jgi:TorA maturation chaperone TorD
MNEERELIRTRLRFLDLLKSFFVKKPDAEAIARWRGMLSALTSQNITPAFDQAARALHHHLSQANRQEIDAEFYTLFTDPFSPALVPASASMYFDGHDFGQTLIRYRDFLGRAGIVLADEIRDPDDSLVLMLDALATLIEENKRGTDTQAMQAELVHDFLAPLAARFTKNLDRNDQARFYRLCAHLFDAYMDMEKDLLPEPGNRNENRELTRQRETM